MLIRGLLAFLALPGVVAIAIPIVWLMTSSHTQVVQPLGLVLLVVGLLALVWCVRDFYVAGIARAHAEEWERYTKRVPRWFWR
jgi:protein-S-isoprenylcysteine O-methyltransferase Ste14